MAWIASPGRACRSSYCYQFGVMLDGTTATYPVDGLRCRIGGEPGTYAVRVPLTSSWSLTVDPAVREQVLVPCNHAVGA